jgi:hypothetical protein
VVVDVALVGFVVEEPVERVALVDTLVEVEIFELDVTDVFEAEVVDEAEAAPGMH